MGSSKRRNMAAEEEKFDSQIQDILMEIFKLMDDNGDGEIDKSEGVAIGMAMGESEEDAAKSWEHMCKDMDNDKDQTIDADEWLSFYKNALKDAPVDEVIEMLNKMKATIAEDKAKK